MAVRRFVRDRMRSISAVLSQNLFCYV
jgi:hypothetical protein